MTDFRSLGVSEELCQVLEAAGITHPFPIQALTIADAMAGRDVSGKAKTGSGKTLAFGIPLVERTATAANGIPSGLVLVPTRELAVQVAEEIEPLAKAKGVSLLAVYGGTNLDQQVKRFENGIDIVVATPGRLIDLVDRNAVNLTQIKRVVIDEADRMADMGFLPQVEWLLRRIEGEHQTLLFSATLDGVVNSLIRAYQHDPVRHEVVSSSVTVDEMSHRFLLVHQMDKAKVAAAIVRGGSRTILFCRTKRGADRLVENLVKEGVEAAAIHGDLRQRNREQALKAFIDGKLPALVATDVAARGIHVDDVDVVIHYDPPEDHKAYLHRSGRTARAGVAGVVVTLLLFNEELAIRRMMKRVGVDQPIVEVFSNDARLGDLSAWDPAAEEAAATA